MPMPALTAGACPLTQVVQDIAVSTVSPTSNQHGLAFSDPDAIATCAAWTPESATSRITTLNGQSYNVQCKEAIQRDTGDQVIAANPRHDVFANHWNCTKQRDNHLSAPVGHLAPRQHIAHKRLGH